MSGRAISNSFGSYRIRPPFVSDGLLSTRTHDQMVENATSEKSKVQNFRVYMSPSLKGEFLHFIHNLRSTQ